MPRKPLPRRACQLRKPPLRRRPASSIAGSAALQPLLPWRLPTVVLLGFLKAYRAPNLANASCISISWAVDRHGISGLSLPDSLSAQVRRQRNLSLYLAVSQTRRPSGSRRGRTQSLSRVVLVRRPHLATAATHWSRRGWRRPEGARSAPPGARPANPAGSSAALSLRTANWPRVSRWSRALGAQERQAPGRAAPGAPLRHNSTVPDYERRLHFWPSGAYCGHSGAYCGHSAACVRMAIMA